MGKPTCEDPERSGGESKINPIEHKTLEDVYRSIVESTTDSIYMVDRECRYCFINKPHLSRLGMPLERVIGRPYGDFHSPDQAGEFTEIVEEVWATKGSIQHNYRSMRDNRYFVRTLSPLREKEHDGKIIGVVVVSKDITSQKQVEESIRESEEKYRAFFKTSRDCVFITSKDGYWIDFNDFAVEFFGYETAEELQNVRIAELYKNKQDRKKHAEKIERNGYTQDYAIDLKKKNGTVINTLITSALIKEKSGQIIGYQGTIKDITERKQAEESLRES
ncbi:MAG: PAS domain-containing protein [Deltaproteobacteria bacterium]|nr:PAS domain-containing protein [Deltaproteobacteria bacterium]